MTAFLTTRRQALGGMGALATMAAFGISATDAAAKNGSIVTFGVRANGMDLGSHKMQFKLQGNVLTVNNVVDIEAKIAGIKVFGYQFKGQEMWRNDRLVGMRTKANMNGKNYSVTARQHGDQLVVDGYKGRITVPGETMPTSYWNPLLLQSRQLLDMQHGTLLNVQSAKVGTDNIKSAGRTIKADRYRMKGDVDLTLWYSNRGVWSAGSMQMQGHRVNFVPQA